MSCTSVYRNKSTGIKEIHSSKAENSILNNEVSSIILDKKAQVELGLGAQVPGIL